MMVRLAAQTAAAGLAIGQVLDYSAVELTVQRPLCSAVQVLPLVQATEASAAARRTEAVAGILEEAASL
jgi:hypothetical protein